MNLHFAPHVPPASCVHRGAAFGRACPVCERTALAVKAIEARRERMSAGAAALVPYLPEVRLPPFVAARRVEAADNERRPSAVGLMREVVDELV